MGHLFEQVQHIGSIGVNVTLLIVLKHWTNNVKCIAYVDGRVCSSSLSTYLIWNVLVFSFRFVPVFTVVAVWIANQSLSTCLSRKHKWLCWKTHVKLDCFCSLVSHEFDEFNLSKWCLIQPNRPFDLSRACTSSLLPVSSLLIASPHCIQVLCRVCRSYRDKKYAQVK